MIWYSNNEIGGYKIMDKKLYKDILGDNNIDYIIKEYFNTLIPTNRSHNFFVDWPKVEKHIQEYKIEFNILNSLIGSEEFDNELKNLLSKYPEIVPTIPILFALSKSKTKKAKRKSGKFQVINDFMDLESDFTEYNFRERELSSEEIEKFVKFFEKTGLKYFFTVLADKSILDYAYGVDVGMDTHARKNRSGKAMELALEPILEEINDNNSFQILVQKKFKYLESELNITLSSDFDLRDRKADFIIIKPNGKIINIEVNYFRGSGSKPQEIVDSYINRQGELKEEGFDFIWVSEGHGWETQKNQARKAFDNIDYLMNLNFAKKGLLEEAISKL